MPASIHTSHRAIFLLPAGIYLVLVVVCAIMPATQEHLRERNAPPREVPPVVARGREVFRSFNCVTCHSQQIRGDEHRAASLDEEPTVVPVAADERYGVRASRASDYDHEAPALLGTQRTGPDLTGVGDRLPGHLWHHWHLYDPRAVSPDSVMPPYRYLYATEPPADASGWQAIQAIEGLGVPGGRLYASPDAVALVEYLLWLKARAP